MDSRWAWLAAGTSEFDAVNAMMSETPYVVKEVFDAKMETQNVKMDAVKDELRSFKRTLTTALLIGIPVLTTIAQYVADRLGG